MPETKYYLTIEQLTTGGICPVCHGEKQVRNKEYDITLNCAVCNATGKYLYMKEIEYRVEVDIDRLLELGIIKKQ